VLASASHRLYAFPDGPATARRIAGRIEELALADTESQKALRRLYRVAWETRLIDGACVAGGLGLVATAGMSGDGDEIDLSGPGEWGRALSLSLAPSSAAWPRRIRNSCR
jgi:hypothetical protein